MSLSSTIKFQKTLALAASASNTFEAEAAELIARRLMRVHDIDPVTMPDRSLYSQMSFADNALLKKLRDEWRAAHPNFYYSRPDSYGSVRRLRHKPQQPRKPKPVDVHMFEGLFDEVFSS